MSTRTLGSEDQWGLLQGELEGHHIFQDPEQKQFEKCLGQTHLLILESLQEQQEATGTHLGDRDADSSHFGELILLQGIGKPGVLQSMGLQRVRHDLVTEQQQQILLQGHQCWQVTFWNPPSSLLMLGPPASRHKSLYDDRR